MPKQSKLKPQNVVETSESESESDSGSSSKSSSDSDNDTKKTTKKIIEDTKQAPKKRGRPRKNAVQTKLTVKSISEKKKLPQDEEIILHLPLYEEGSSSEKNLFTAIDNSEKSPGKSGKAVVSLSTDESESDDNSKNNTKDLISEIKKKDILIKKLKTALLEAKNDTNRDTGIYTIKEAKTRTMNLKLINIKDNKPIVIDKCDVACWWCTENFDTMPCFIPDRYLGEKYYVFGCFCTYSCAKSYNSNMNDYRVPVRTSLINKLYMTIFGTNESIPLAPPKELLQKFGGVLTIEEFRNKSLLCKKDYRLSLPPLIPLIHTFDEVNKDSSASNKTASKQKGKK